MKVLGFLKGSVKKQVWVHACVRKEGIECANVAKY